MRLILLKTSEKSPKMNLEIALPVPRLRKPFRWGGPLARIPATCPAGRPAGFYRVLLLSDLQLAADKMNAGHFSFSSHFFRGKIHNVRHSFFRPIANLTTEAQGRTCWTTCLKKNF